MVLTVLFFGGRKSGFGEFGAGTGHSTQGNLSI